MSDPLENDLPEDDELRPVPEPAGIDEFKALLEKLRQCVDAAQRKCHLTTALFGAVRRDDAESVMLLLGEGANVNARNASGDTPLHVAARMNLSAMAVLLTEAGADLDLKNDGGKTVWNVLKRFNHPKTSRLLLDASRKRIMHGDIYDLKERDDKLARFVHAVKHDHLGDVIYLIAGGVDVNGRIENGGTPLHVAANKNYPEIVTALLEAGANVNVRDDDGETPLHRASLNNGTESVSLLVKAGADIEAMDNLLDSPLHYAAEGNAVGSIAALLDAGARIDSVGYGGRTPLFEAIFWDNPEAVALLLRRGANVNFRIDLENDNTHGESPLHTAAMCANTEIISLLLEAGADIEAMSVRGKKPIDYAVRDNRTDIVLFLMSRGAEVPEFFGYSSPKDPWAKAEKWYKSVKKSDTSPERIVGVERFCRTVRQGQVETVSLLLHKRRTDVNALDKHGYSPFHWAALEGNLEIMTMLLDNGADLEFRTGKGSPPLHLAAWRYILNGKREAKGLPVEKIETLDALALLLDRGANADAVNAVGYSLLHIAAMNDEVEIMCLLLGKDADLELRDGNGRTALFHAVGPARTKDEAAKILIDHGARLNVRDREYYRTPLHWACIHRAHKIVNALLQAGADRNVKDKKGRTPLDYSR